MRLISIRFAALSLAILAATTTGLHAAALSTAFTYQGQLKSQGAPLTGTVDLAASLFDVESDGVALGTLELDNISATNGLFTVELDFGAVVFNGDARWLEVAVRSPHDPGDTEAFTTLTPRQPLTATPYALQTRGLFVDDAGNLGIGTTNPAQTTDVRGQLQVRDSIRLDAADEPMVVRQWNPMSSGRLQGFGRWGMFMENQNMFFGMPGTDFAGGASLRFGGWLEDSTREDWMTITKTGNVGIGTTTPNARLDVLTSVRASRPESPSQYLEMSSPGFQGIFLTARTGENNKKSLIIQNVHDNGGTPAGSSDIVFRTGAESAPTAEIMRLTESGNVGIGTSSPQEKLHVETATGGCAVYGLSEEGNPLVRGPILNAVGVCASATSERGNAIGLRATAESSSQWTTGVSGGAFGTGGTNVGVSGTASGATRNWGGYFIGDGYFSGKVGIGTTTPGVQLDVVGPIRSGGAGGGIVSIPNPNEEFAVASFSWRDDVARIRVGGSGAGAESGFDIQTTGDTSLMRLLHNGNVGIGTVSPSARLEVWGTSTTPATFNRLGNDGVIVSLKQDHSGEGSISVAGNTVSYNSFTGSHLGWSDEAPARGMLMTMTGENRNLNGNRNSETIYGVTPSSSANDSKCLGAHLALLEPSRPLSPENPRLIMAVGNGDMWVVSTGRNLRPGDYLISSHVKGHAMLDDEKRFAVGYVVARVAESVDWSNITETVDGRKHQKISVFFENFVRGGSHMAVAQTAVQQEQISALQAEIFVLKESIRNITHSHKASTLEVATPSVAAILCAGILAIYCWRGRNAFTKAGE